MTRVFLKNRFLLCCSDCTVGHKCLKITFKILSEVMNFFFKYMCLLTALSEFIDYLSIDTQLGFMLWEEKLLLIFPVSCPPYFFNAATRVLKTSQSRGEGFFLLLSLSFSSPSPFSFFDIQSRRLCCFHSSFIFFPVLSQTSKYIWDLERPQLCSLGTAGSAGPWETRAHSEEWDVSLALLA